MKTPKLVLSVLACSVVVGNYAQNIPTHAPYVELLPTKEISIAGGDKKTVYLDFYDYFESWEPGVPLSEDENFYIARVPMKKRFVNTATQVDPTMTQDRKFSMWTPMGISDTYWQSLPRYVFEAIISVCGPTWIRKAAGLSRGYVYRVHTATLLTVTV